jgi:hypothetical protein
MSRHDYKPTEFIPQTKKRRCQEYVVRYEGLTNFSGQCYHPAKSGKDYCGVHDPESKAKRQAKTKAAWDAKNQEWRDQSFSKRFRAALESIEQGHNDPRSVAKEVLDKWRDY